MTVLDILSITMFFIGAAFFITGSIGMLRMPNVLLRLHASAKADNLGLAFLFAGLALQASSIVIVFKLILIWILLIVSSAAACNIIAQKALRHDSASEKHGMNIIALLMDLSLALAMLCFATFALLHPKLKQCIICFMAFGILMGFAWARLEAPDVAMVEVIIGSGLTGALLLSTLAVVRDLWKALG